MKEINEKIRKYDSEGRGRERKEEAGRSRSGMGRGAGNRGDDIMKNFERRKTSQKSIYHPDNYPNGNTLSVSLSLPLSLSLSYSVAFLCN